MKEIADYKTIRKVKRLTEAQIALIKALRLENRTYKQIKEEIGCSITTIFAICHGDAELGYDQKETAEYKEKLATVKLIREEFLAGKSKLYLAEKYNFTRAWITQIVTNKQYKDENYNPKKHDACEHSIFTVDEILSMRERYDNGEDVWNIINDFRGRIKSNPTGIIRKICKREMFKNI